MAREQKLFLLSVVRDRKENMGGGTDRGKVLRGKQGVKGEEKKVPGKTSRKQKKKRGVGNNRK